MSCGSEESNNSESNKDIEIIVTDSTYVPDVTTQSLEDTITVSYQKPDNYETLITEMNGDFYTLYVDYLDTTYYYDSADITYKINAPIGVFRMGEPAKYAPLKLNYFHMCPAVVGKEHYQPLNIMAENKDIELDESFFAHHELTSVEYDFNEDDFDILYKYEACDIYECGIFIRYTINLKDQTSEIYITDYNDSPMN